MKIGIVGGSGNISTGVVRHLLDRGHDVTCITRGRSGGLPDGAKQLVGDRNDTDWFIEAVQSARFDAAIDFFAFTPEHAHASLQAFRDVGHFVHVSTVVAYGEQFDWLPVTEDHPNRPGMQYGANKAQIEHLYRSAHESSGFPVTIIKPSTTYGRQRVVRQLGIDTRWIRRIREGRPLLKVGEGNALHHLLHVDDAAPAFVGAIERDRTIGQTYNLVHPHATNWGEVHGTAMAILGREVDLVPVSSDELFRLDPDRFRLVRGIFAHNLLYSAEKIMRDIPEFRPQVSLAEGMADAFEHLEREGLVEEVPYGDWEDQIIESQKSAYLSVLV